MAARHGAAKIARIVFAAAAAALAGAVGLSLLAVGVAHTDPGRELVKQQAEREARDYIRGEVEIGSLSGWLFGSFTLRDVYVFDEDDRLVAAAARVTIDYSPEELVRGVADLDRVTVQSPVVFADVDEDARLNLLEVFEIPPPLPVAIRDLAVSDGEVEIAVIGRQVAALRALEVRGAARIEPEQATWFPPGRPPARQFGEILVAIESLSGTLWGPDPRGDTLAVSGRGRVERVGDEIDARAVRFEAGDSFVDLPELTGDDDGRMAGRVAATVRAADVRALSPRLPLEGDVELTGEVLRERAGEPVTVPLAGAVAGARTHAFAALVPEQPRADLEVEILDLDPTAAVRGAPQGELAVDVHAAARGEGVAGPDAEIGASAEGQVAGQRLERAELSAALAQRILTADGSLVVPGARGAGQARIDLGRDIPELTAGELSFSITDIPALTGLDAAGRARGSLEATGPLGALAIRGAIRGEELGIEQAGVGDVRADVEVLRFPDAPRGGGGVVLRDIRLGDEQISGAEARVRYRDRGERAVAQLSAGSPEEPYAARGQIELDLSDELTRASVEALSLRTRDVMWRAGGSTFAVTPAGELVLDRFQMSSDAGRIAAEGTARGVRAGEVDVRIDELDLSRMRSAFAPDALPWEGELALRTHMRWPPERGRAIGEIDSLTMPLLTAVDVDFDIGLTAEEVTVSLETLGEDDDLVEVIVTAAVPDPLYDIGAWTDLGLGAIEELALEIADVEIISRR